MKKKSLESQIFGKRLQRLRAEKNISVTHIVKHVGVSKSTYRDWEQGRAITGLPYPKLAQVFGTSFSELFGLEETTASDILKKLKMMEDLISEIKVAL